MANLRTNNLSGEQGQNAYRGSVFFDGEHSYLALASGEVPSFGTGDFTIEFWINQGVNASNYTVLFALTSSTNTDRLEVAIHSSTIQVYTDTATWRDTGYAPLSGVYEHIAFVRDSSGNTLKMYANGVEKWSVSNTRDYDEAWSTKIGSYDSSSYGYFQGYLSNFRITDGTALYTTNYFTPPTSELTADANTVLLCCQDSDDPTREETGKTITANGGLLQTASELTAGELTSSNYSSAASDWSFSGGTATVSMSSNGYASLGSVPSRLRNGELYELVVNVTTFNAGKITFGQSNAGNADFTIALGRNVIRHVYAGSTQDSGGIAIYARDATGGGYAINLLSLKQVIHGDQPKVIPPYGVDAGNTFGGPIRQSSQGYMYFPTGRTEERGAGIGIVAGGYSAATSPIDTIESIRIQTMGNSIQFGTLNAARFASGAVSSTSRVIFGGGYQPSNLNSMEFVNPTTQGNGTDAGDLSAARKMPAGLGNSTRGIFAGGREPGVVNTIEFVTIASLGDAVNFGDLTSATFYGKGCASPTRGVIACSAAPSSRSNVINFITIASAGDAQDFGDLTEVFGMTGFGLSDATRGVIGGHYISPANNHSNVINFVTIATTGDATDFGDMVTGTGHGGDGFSDKTRGVITGQYTNSPFQTAPLNSDSQGAVNLIQMITVQTTGNAVDFGDLTANAASNGRKYYANGNSNSHGGLS